MFLPTYCSIMLRKCAEKILSKKRFYTDPIITKTDILYIIDVVYISHGVVCPPQSLARQVSRAPCWAPVGRGGAAPSRVRAPQRGSWRGRGAPTCFAEPVPSQALGGDSACGRRSHCTSEKHPEGARWPLPLLPQPSLARVPQHRCDRQKERVVSDVTLLWALTSVCCLSPTCTWSPTLAHGCLNQAGSCGPSALGPRGSTGSASPGVTSRHAHSLHMSISLRCGLIVKMVFLRGKWVMLWYLQSSVITHQCIYNMRKCPVWFPWRRGSSEPEPPAASRMGLRPSRLGPPTAALGPSACLKCLQAGPFPQL